MVQWYILQQRYWFLSNSVLIKVVFVYLVGNTDVVELLFKAVNIGMLRLQPLLGNKGVTF